MPLRQPRSESFSTAHPAPTPTLFPYTTLFRSDSCRHPCQLGDDRERAALGSGPAVADLRPAAGNPHRSEEHTSELQSHSDLVCRLLLEKKNTSSTRNSPM